MEKVSFLGEFRTGEKKEALVTVTATIDADFNGQVHVDAPIHMPMSLVSETLKLIADHISDGGETGTDYYTPN
jgi:hypothetical protein